MAARTLLRVGGRRRLKSAQLLPQGIACLLGRWEGIVHHVWEDGGIIQLCPFSCCVPSAFQIPPDADESMILSFFAKYGRASSAQIMRGRNGESRGCAIVVCEDRDSAESIIKSVHLKVTIHREGGCVLCFNQSLLIRCGGLLTVTF